MVCHLFALLTKGTIIGKGTTITSKSLSPRSLPSKKKTLKLWLHTILSNALPRKIDESSLLQRIVHRLNKKQTFEDAMFSLNRLKLSFVSSLNSWAVEKEMVCHLFALLTKGTIIGKGTTITSKSLSPRSLPSKKKTLKLWLHTILSNALPRKIDESSLLQHIVNRLNKKQTFEDAMFSLNRLKLSFVSSLNSWAWFITDVNHYIVRILLCILWVLAYFGLVNFLFALPLFYIGV